MKRGFETTLEAVQKNLIQRDYIDSNRKESPLLKTDDAIEIDNTFLNKDEQLYFALELVKKKIQEEGLIIN